MKKSCPMKKNSGCSKVALWVFICLLIATLVALLISLQFNGPHSTQNSAVFKPNNKNSGRVVNANDLTSEHGLKPIGSTILMKKLAQKESFLLFIGRPSCPDCQAFMPLLNKAMEETGKPELYYWNTDEAKKDDKQNHSQLYEALSKQMDVNWVPSLFKIKDGQVFDRLDDETDAKLIKHFLEKYKE